ncbi:hypothetical protein Tco_1355383 [Tanacetum coccineum]
MFSRLGLVEGERKEQRRRSLSQASSRSASVFSHLGARRQEQRRKDARTHRSYVTCSSERQKENEREYQRHKWEDSIDEPLESEDSAGGRHWKRQTEDLEDHLKTFTTAAKVERWVMPTWCYMFNSTLLGSTRLRLNDNIYKIVDEMMSVTKAFIRGEKAAANQSKRRGQP